MYAGFGAYVCRTWCLCMLDMSLFMLDLVLMYAGFGAYVRWIWRLCILDLVLMYAGVGTYVCLSFSVLPHLIQQYSLLESVKTM